MGLCGRVRALEKGVPPVGGHSPWVFDLVHGPWMRLQLPHAALAGASPRVVAE